MWGHISWPPPSPDCLWTLPEHLQLVYLCDSFLCVHRGTTAPGPSCLLSLPFPLGKGAAELSGLMDNRKLSGWGAPWSCCGDLSCLAHPGSSGFSSSSSTGNFKSIPEAKEGWWDEVMGLRDFILEKVQQRPRGLMYCFCSYADHLSERNAGGGWACWAARSEDSRVVTVKDYQHHWPASVKSITLENPRASQGPVCAESQWKKTKSYCHKSFRSSIIFTSIFLRALKGI